MGLGVKGAGKSSGLVSASGNAIFANEKNTKRMIPRKVMPQEIYLKFHNY